VRAEDKNPSTNNVDFCYLLYRFARSQMNISSGPKAIGLRLS